MPNTNTNTNKQTQSVKVVVNNQCCSKKPKRKQHKKPQPPPEPTIPPVQAQQSWQRGIAHTAPRPIVYVPPTQQIIPDTTPMGIPSYFQTAHTNLQTTMNTMNENFQNELLDVKSMLEAQATKQAHLENIQQIAKAAQDEFQRQLDTFNVMPSLEEVEEPTQPEPEQPEPTNPGEPPKGLWGDEELEDFMKPTPVKDLINKFEGKEQTESEDENIFSPDKYDYITRLYGEYQQLRDHNKMRPVRKELMGYMARAGYETENAKLKGLMKKYDDKFQEMHQK